MSVAVQVKQCCFSLNICKYLQQHNFDIFKYSCAASVNWCKLQTKKPKIFCSFFTQQVKPLGHRAAENIKPAVSYNICQIYCILTDKLVLNTCSCS